MRALGEIRSSLRLVSIVTGQYMFHIIGPSRDVEDAVADFHRIAGTCASSC